MKKQILTGALALSILVSGGSTFAKTPELLIEREEVEIEIEVKNKFTLEGIEGYKKGNIEMVPLREVAEERLGLKVAWKAEDRSVEIGEGPQWTSIKIGENSYFFARIAPFKLSQAPELKDGLTYVPVEFFTEVLRYELEVEEEHILDGFIKEIRNEDQMTGILVEANDSNEFVDEIFLHVSDDTVIVNEDDELVSFEDLKVGTKIKTVLPEIMTMSLPPQGAAIKIIVEGN